MTILATLGLICAGAVALVAMDAVIYLIADAVDRRRRRRGPRLR